jgi:hypothetical protein
LASPPHLSPGPVAINDANQTMSEQGSLPGTSDHFGRSPSPVGAFTFDGPSPFITSAAINYLQTIPAGQRWTDMIISFLRLEELPAADGVSSKISFFYSTNYVTVPSSSLQ